MNSIESILFWSTTLLLAVSFFSGLLSIIFRKPNVVVFSKYFSNLALVTLTIMGIIRWVITDHPPFVTLFESMITSIWFTLLFLFIIQFKRKYYSILVVPISFITFSMMGWASSLPAEASPLSASLTNVWLFIHASFATSGAASFLIASSFAVLLLIGEEKLKTMEKISALVPDFTKIPKHVLNYLIFGMILWGVMIVSGSIWAHVAWGRYWAWDPIELWSLISWLLYGLLLHSRLTFKISNRLFSLLTIIASLIVLFALWGVGYIYETIHTYG